MNPLLQSEIDNNLVSCDSWDAFANHRKNLTGLLAGALPPKPARLCILGAGNCNDLDLGALAGSYREIHLVDIDGAALTRGVARQGLANHFTLHLHAGIDVSGLIEDMAAWSPLTTIGPAELEACVERPVRRLALPGPFDVVASACLLSQLMGGIVQTVGSAHPRFVELLQAVRTGHLRLLAHLIAPGGRGMLITDVLSSDTLPTLGSVPEEALPAVITQAVRARNFFHGVNPYVLTSAFQTDPVLNSQINEVQRTRPWLWNHGLRIYAVCALTIRKRT